MSTITEIDWKYYWLGYSMGVTSYKRILESPTTILNYGKQGVKVSLTNKQKVSFILGLQDGRRKIVNNHNQVLVKMAQSRKPTRTTKPYLTLAVGEIQGVRGSYVDVPVYIENNRVDNRGVAGFQLSLAYDSTKLDFVSITQSSAWTGTLISDTSTTGTILAQGFKSVADKVDCAICNLRFLVKADVSESTAEIALSLQGSPGTGSGSELFTLITEELYYITPITLTSGKVLLESKQPAPIASEITAVEGTTTIGSGSSSVDFSFDATVGVPAGITPSGGISAYVNVYLNGTRIGTQKVSLEQGTKKYSGNVMLSLPSLETGSITYEIVVEPDNAEDEGFYYVFIKAGALFILQTEVKREEVNALPPLDTKRKPYDKWYIYDAVILTIISGGSHEPIDLLITDTWVVGDNALIYTYIQKMYSIVDTMTLQDILDFVHYNPNPTHQPINEKITELLTLLDLIDIELHKATTKKDADTVSVSDSVAFTTHK